MVSRFFISCLEWKHSYYFFLYIESGPRFSDFSDIQSSIFWDSPFPAMTQPRGSRYMCVIWVYDSIYLMAVSEWALARYVKMRVGHASGMPGTFSPPSPSNENRGLAIPACITARAWPLVPWCLSGSLTCGGGENVPGILGIVSLRLGHGWVIAYIVLCAT